MQALSDDQQSAIFAFAWNGGIVSSTNHFNIVHRCFNEAVTGNINKLMSCLLSINPLKEGNNEENLKTVELYSSVKYHWMC